MTQPVNDALHFCVLAPKSFWQAIPLDIVMCLVHAVPLTQETRKFSVPELQSKQKCNDFQVRTNVPLLCVTLHLLQ